VRVEKSEPPTTESSRLIPDAIKAILADEESGPVMVTGWALVAEYISDDGSANVAAWSSDDPPWRISGLLTVANELLDVTVYDTSYDSEDDY